MSENFDELGELGDKIKKIIDTAVSTKDYRQMTEDIKQTVGQTVNSAVNSAVDSGSEAIKNGLNNVFGTGNSQSGDSGVYRNKTKEFEEKRRREREQEQERQRIEKEKAKEKMLTLYERNTGGRMKGMMIAVSGGTGNSGPQHLWRGGTYEFPCDRWNLFYGSRSFDRSGTSRRRY